MREIPKAKVIDRIRFENPWWRAPGRVGRQFEELPRRADFTQLHALVARSDVRRAVVVMGPRRVGKTVIMHQLIAELIEAGQDPLKLCYLSVEHPIYNGLGLEDLFGICREATGKELAAGYYLFFDEIQYCRDWEVHLKALVDSYPDTRFVASGSAAAALRLKSIESGAGRFTDVLLPPLSFFEFVSMTGAEGVKDAGRNDFDIEALNRSFLEYLKFGGYPELALSATVRQEPERFIKSDIIEKVLLRDLPQLYGIRDVQELNSLFTTLAFNTGNEVTLQSLSQGSGVAKNTIKRYIEYLEAAFLIRVLNRVNKSARRFQRANFFKVYLTTPAIWSALFAPVEEGDEAIGSLVETAIVSQWFHSATRIYYARWGGGEVDIVRLKPNQRVGWALEVKWSDRCVRHPDVLSKLAGFCKANKMTRAWVTTRSEWSSVTTKGVSIACIPCSVLCYLIGQAVLDRGESLEQFMEREPPAGGG